MSTISQKISPAEHWVSLFEQSRETLNAGSSPLLNRMRKVSIKRFAQAGIPDFKTEDYKYTNLKPAFEKNYKQEVVRENGVIDLNVVFSKNIPQLDAHLVFLVNGWFYNGNNPAAGLPKGVVLSSLEQIANEKPELLQDYLNRQGSLVERPVCGAEYGFCKGWFLPLHSERHCA